MADSDLTNCFHAFLDKPFLWFTKGDVARKLKCFEVFKTEAPPQYIWVLIALLKSDDPRLRDGAAQTIGVLFHKIKSQTAFYDALKHIEISLADLEYYKTAFAPDIYLKLLAIASFNKNGYLREKAVHLLGAARHPEAIRFIIFRLADWVANVRDAAETALRNYFRPEFIDDFLNRLPLFEWLLTVGRSDLKNIHAEIYQFIFGFGLVENEPIYQKFKRLEDKSRLLYVKNYLKFKTIDAAPFKLFAGDKLPLIKIELLKRIEALTGDEQKYFIENFLGDSSVKVRIYAIYSTKPFRAEFLDRIRAAIFDRAEAVRELARFILRDSATDFAEAYRQRLREDESSAAAFLGLAEVGTRADLPVFENALRRENRNVKIIIGCLNALNRLDKTSAKKFALGFLNHPSAKIRNRCIEILASAADETVLETAREVFQKGGVDQKKTVLRLFDRIGGWKVVGDFIIALADADEEIRESGWSSLVKWRGKQIFSRPLPEERERIAALYREFDQTKPKLGETRAGFWSELPVFFR